LKILCQTLEGIKGAYERGGWYAIIEHLGEFAEQHIMGILLVGVGGLALALFLVMVFKGINREWKLPFVKYKPKNR